ncbi:hypothetical protein C0J52_27185, partial [Blattella germanica]
TDQYIKVIVRINFAKNTALNISVQPELIRKNGYPAESHIIETEDGYLLTLHRIPHGKHTPQNKTLLPIFLQHGLLSSSADWLINGPNKSLGEQWYKLINISKLTSTYRLNTCK